MDRNLLKFVYQLFEKFEQKNMVRLIGLNAKDLKDPVIF